MRKIIAIFAITASAVILSACKKNDLYSRDDDSYVIVSTTVAGRVTNLNNVPVNNALISAGTSVTITDIDGKFTLKNVQLNKDAGYIKVIKSGFFSGSRTFLVNPNAVNNIKIKLIPKVFVGNFDASSGGRVITWGSCSVEFSPGSIVDATTGASYSGNVSVSAFFLNPADPFFSEYMPGDLRGINKGNEERILQSFGMGAIELNNASGEKLQLAAGKTATITLPISPLLQAIAPASIPLWYFDETKGTWKEEGIAVRQGNNYAGTVAHFSFWNCDLPLEYVKFTMTLKDQKGIPIANNLITISSSVYGTRGSYTDSKGAISGLIPAKETLVLNVLNQCGEIIYTKNIGPFVTDTDLGSATVDFKVDQYSVTLSGTVINCSNTIVTNGFIQVTTGNNFFNTAVTDGNFTITFLRCMNATTPVTVVAYDLTNIKQSVPQTFDITNSVNQNIAQLKACENYCLTKYYYGKSSLNCFGK